MPAKVRTCAVIGLDGYIIEVERPFRSPHYTTYPRGFPPSPS